MITDNVIQFNREKSLDIAILLVSKGAISGLFLVGYGVEFGGRGGELKCSWYLVKGECQRTRFMVNLSIKRLRILLIADTK